jgi:hypothetical protein
MANPARNTGSCPNTLPSSPFSRVGRQVRPTLGAKLFQSVLYAFWPASNGPNCGLRPVSVPGLKRLPTPETPQTSSRVAVERLALVGYIGNCST